MTEATYTAWDGKLYEWPPPQGWYEASDGRWWPEGYGPRPEPEVETDGGLVDDRHSAQLGVVDETDGGLVDDRGSAELGVVEAERPEGAEAEVWPDEEVPVGSTSYPSSTGFDSRSLTADTDDSATRSPSPTGFSPDQGVAAESTAAAGSSWTPTDSGSSADAGFGSETGASWAPPDSGSMWAPSEVEPSPDAASSFAGSDDDTAGLDQLSVPGAAATTGDHKPMTAWVAESADSSAGDIVTEPQFESVSTPDAGVDEWADRSIDDGLEEFAEGRDRDEDAEPGRSQLGTSEAAVAGAAAAATVGGLTDLAGKTPETGSELFMRLQAEAEAQRGAISEQVEAGSEVAGDASTEAVTGAAPTVVPDALSEAISDAATVADPYLSEAAPTTEQPVVDTSSRSEFSGRFGNSRPGFANSAYDEPTLDEPTLDEPALDEPVYHEAVHAEPTLDEAVHAEATYGEVTQEPAVTDASAPDSIDDVLAHADQGYDPEDYSSPQRLDVEAGDATGGYDAPIFVPSQASPAYDAPEYDPEASTDPGFGGERRGGDTQVPAEPPVSGQAPAQVASPDYESPQAAVSPMEAPTPSAGAGRRILYAILGVLALVAAGVAGYLAFQVQNDSDDGADGTEQGAGQVDDEAVVGSLTNPHDPGSGIRIEYPDGAETQPWTLQLLSMESDGADGEARLVMQIVNDDPQGQGELADLQLALVAADGNDLAPTPSPCRAGDSLDLTATVEAGQSVSGPVCWSVAGVLPDGTLLAVESTKAQGRVYIALP